MKQKKFDIGIFDHILSSRIVNKMKFVIQRVTHASVTIDENVKTNLGLKDVKGELLLISQFTLYADCKKGNRPSFINAGGPEESKEIYEYIIEKCKNEVDSVECGEFGADMKVELINDGPFTIILNSEEIM